MTHLTIIGAGMSPGDLTCQARRAVESADCILGAPRLTAPFVEKKPCFPGYTPGDVAKYAHVYGRIAVLLSGDVGFYSGAAKLLASYPDAELIPGISSVTAFFAKCHLPWQEAALVSAHGKQCCPAEPVRRNGFTFFLTGGNVPELAQALTDAGFGYLKVHVGENLGAENERILCTTPSELCRLSLSSLTVLLVENPHPDTRLRVGIADEAFVRTTVPMTKQAIRAQIASCLQPRQTDTLWDVGCGTGSVTVEMALAAHKGRVWACDVAPEAVALTRENCRKFHISNVTVKEGAAPEALMDFPAPDAVFIGGSKGNLSQIIGAALSKNPNALIVLTAIALETLTQGMAALQDAGLDVEIQQVFAAQAKSVGKLHLLMGQNPTFILTGRRTL